MRESEKHEIRKERRVSFGEAGRRIEEGAAAGTGAVVVAKFRVRKVLGICIHTLREVR